jgi:Uma2 family endonuclease
MALETLLTVDEFLDLPETPGVYQRELINGRVLEMAAPSSLHAEIQIKVGFELSVVTRSQFPDLVVLGPTEFFVNAESRQIPDVCVVERALLDAMELHRGAKRGSPDLAVEIVSPSESAEDIQEKTENYLAAGTRTVWVVYTRTRQVSVRHHNGMSYFASFDSTIDAPEVLPGVTIEVSKLFPR